MTEVDFSLAMKELESSHEVKWVLDFITATKKDKEVFLTEVIARKKKQEPLAYILGEWVLGDFSFKVGPGVLIPRPETEELVELAVTMFSAFFEKDKPHNIVDFGSGSGCIAISVALRLEALGFKHLTVCMVERSQDAFKYLNHNIQHYVNLSESTRFEAFNCDWNNFKTQKNFSMILSNPPYISEDEFKTLGKSVLDFEPKAALVSDREESTDKAIASYKEISQWAEEYLVDDGLLVFELGQLQKKFLENLQKKHSSKFYKVDFVKDMAGKERFAVLGF